MNEATIMRFPPDSKIILWWLSALEVRHDEALYKSTFTLLYFKDRREIRRGSPLARELQNVTGYVGL